MATTPEETQKKAIPPLEQSAQFKQRTTDALGGAPASPAMFQPLGRGTAAAGSLQASGAVATKPAAKTSIFDTDPENERLKARLEQIRSRSAGLVQAVTAKADSLAAALVGVDTHEGFQAYAKLHGVDLKKAQQLVDDLEKALDPVIK